MDFATFKGSGVAIVLGLVLGVVSTQAAAWWPNGLLSVPANFLGPVFLAAAVVALFFGLASLAFDFPH